MAIHCAPHLAGEFTGYPEETELVLVRSLSTLPNTWEAIETIPRPYGMLACATLTAEGVEPFTEDDRKDLLTKWAAEFDRLRGEDVAPVAAWVFVELARRGTTRFYAAVRPSAGVAFAHLLNYACHDRHSDWEWLHDENGNRQPGLPEPTRCPDCAFDRFEWADGSAIVADSFTWWFGFHRGRLTEQAVIEALHGGGPGVGQPDRRDPPHHRLTGKETHPMPQYHFAPPLAGEFTGDPQHTDLVVRRSTTKRNLWQAWDIRDMISAEYTTPTAFLPEADRNHLLVAWAMAYDRQHYDEAPKDGQPAWVFVHLNTTGPAEEPTCYFAAIRPSAGQAFAHILRYQCYGQRQDWRWLFRDVPPGQVHTVEVARFATITVGEGGHERYEWPDGSAIVVQAGMAWDFGFSRQQLQATAVVEACAAEDVHPMFAWPAEVAVPAN